jgi:tripartite-type tricarboxylate transporter receptor subunit TctC
MAIPARHTRRAAFGVIAAAASSQPVRAQPPRLIADGARPARMINPAAVGSAPDLAARILAEALARRRGHPMVVENRVGADGTIAADAFVRSPPGEALFFSFSDVLTVAPLMHERVPYDPEADFTPLSVVADDLFAVSVGPGLPARTLEDLVVLARARPGALNWFASPGTPYLAFRVFLRDAGIDMTYVSYRGAPPALLDLAAGRIQAALTPLAPALPLAREGRTRLLVATTPERPSVMPDLPTTAEAGMPGFRITGLLGLFGWRGMPDAVRDDLSAQTRAIVAEPATTERFRAVGMAARGSTPAAYAEELARSRARWAALAREFGTKPPT